MSIVDYINESHDFPLFTFSSEGNWVTVLYLGTEIEIPFDFKMTSTEFDQIATTVISEKKKQILDFHKKRFEDLIKTPAVETTGENNNQTLKPQRHIK